MNIAWVVPLVPYPPRDGGSIRIYQLLKRLARRHSVRVLALDDGDTGAGARPALGKLGVTLETFTLPAQRLPRWSWRWWRAKGGALRDPGYFYYQPALAERLRTLCRREEIDVALLETLKLHAYSASVGVDRAIFSRQNYEPALAYRLAGILPPSRERLLWRFGGRLCERAERRICRGFRFITAVSEPEAVTFRRLAPRAEVTVVPNGVDLERFTPGDDPAADGMVVVSGLMSYLPNRDSALFFAREVWPQVRRECPVARFAVIGHQAVAALPELAGAPGVELHEPGDGMVGALRAATVVVVPLRAGAGTRIKVLEALALGKAVVSTSIGCEGLEVEHGRELLIGDRPQDMAGLVIKLLRDPVWRRELGASGRKLVEARYGWERSAETLDRFCAWVGAERSAPGRP